MLKVLTAYFIFFYSDYPEPLSDAFLVLVFSDIQANSELCTRLDIRETLFAEVSNQPVVYLNESLKTMKVNTSFYACGLCSFSCDDTNP